MLKNSAKIKGTQKVQSLHLRRRRGKATRIRKKKINGRKE